jgi:Leucine-rich repeat (LRR) protein
MKIKKEFIMKTPLINRKTIVSIFVVMLLTYSLQGISYAQEAPDTIVEFSDANLAKIVRLTLRLATGDGVDLLKIPKAELVKLTDLPANKFGIKDLTGLEHATQLRRLYLRANSVSDITPLTQLTHLTNIDLWGNRITDVTPLAQLTQLTDLDLGGPRIGNDIIDISPLAGLTELRELRLSSNDIIDISPLAGLTELRELTLPFNRISDISPLSQLTELTLLTLDANQISDIAPLAQLTNLTLLSVTANQIRDITPIAQMKQLTFLQLGYNQIRGITPLAQAELLTELHLNNNQIRDLSPLATLTRLITLNLSSNQISDVTPLAQLSESLMELDLRDNRIQDVTPLASLIYLEELSLRDNPITNTLPLNAILDENPDLDIDIEVVTEETGPTLTAAVSTLEPFVTLDGSVATLTLSSGAFAFRTDIEDALTISGITGITFHWTDIDRVSDREVTIKLTFTGSINTNRTLIFTLGPGGIKNYNGPGLTTEFPVSAPAEITQGLVASTPVQLTKANLHGSVVALTLGRNKRYDTNPSFVSGNVTVSGIEAVTFRRHNVKRVNDMQITISLEFNGNIDTDSMLTFTVGAKAIANYDGPAFTAEIPITVSATTEITTTPQTTTTDATVSIMPSSITSPAIGQQLEFTLNITGGEAVAGYQANVGFDTTALRYVESSNGDYLPAGAFFVAPKVEGNFVTLNAASLAGESNGDGTLVTLTFEVVTAKASTLTLSDVLLTDSAGETVVPQVKNAEITETQQPKGDVNGDGTVNITDLVLVAGALGNSAAAPFLHPQVLEMFTATEVKRWLSQAQQLDTTSPRGILFLQQLLIALTPKETTLLPNYPNPFNPETWIPYHLARDADVTLRIYTVNGTLVRTLTLGYQPAGMYQSRSDAAYWDGKNAQGEPVVSGVYFYTLTAENFTATRKMLILK